jgi:hypothetical protein
LSVETDGHEDGTELADAAPEKSSNIQTSDAASAARASGSLRPLAIPTLIIR